MSAVVLLVCAAALGQPAPGASSEPPPPAIPGVVVSQPLNIFYQPPPEQAGKKNPPAEQPPAEQPPAEQPATACAEYAADRPWYSVHAQATVVSQGNLPFISPYIGPNSLPPNGNFQSTNTDTLFLDVRLWQGADFVFNPEVSGGTGLGQTLGLAGFPNGEATRVGQLEPTPYIARAIFRQRFDLDGEWEKVEDAPNQIAGVQGKNRFTISIGKMSAEDVFDDNVYSHDPRTSFLSWALMYTGAWDYPANTRGYNYGIVLDYTNMFYAVRYGIFGEPSTANGPVIDHDFLKAHGQILEFEQDFILGDNPAHLREFGYLNTAHMGQYRQSLQETPVDPDITATRNYRNKYGFGLSYDLEFSPDLGFFARAGWNDGQTESWAFTEIDQTAALGFLLKGTAWGRKQDQVGLAGVINGLSDAHKDYLAAGGVGFIIGDGALKYGPEEILETFYDWDLHKGINVTFDFQGVNNPAYNEDRGPVAIFGVRLHLEY
ncbi:MAG TPA: carbohydrate porin [Gemmataceae bacterium]|nr:carbohydrate porin [Gemmataceae bacterium]